MVNTPVVAVIVGSWGYLLDNPFSVLKLFRNAQQDVIAQKGEWSPVLICFFNKSWTSGRSPLTKRADKAPSASRSQRPKCSLNISSKQNQKSATDSSLFCLQDCIMAQSILTGKTLGTASSSDWPTFLTCLIVVVLLRLVWWDAQRLFRGVFPIVWLEPSPGTSWTPYPM